MFERKGKDLYFLMAVVLLLWLCSLYAFAKWRYKVCLKKGVILETVLHDRLTQIFHTFTTGIALALIVYII
jgi:hypothetical protein